MTRKTLPPVAAIVLVLAFLAATNGSGPYWP
jgi:hypothetical protein